MDKRASEFETYTKFKENMFKEYPENPPREFLEEFRQYGELYNKLSPELRSYYESLCHETPYSFS